MRKRPGSDLDAWVWLVNAGVIRAAEKGKIRTFYRRVHAIYRGSQGRLELCYMYTHLTLHLAVADLLGKHPTRDAVEQLAITLRDDWNAFSFQEPRFDKLRSGLVNASISRAEALTILPDSPRLEHQIAALALVLRLQGSTADSYRQRVSDFLGRNPLPDDIGRR